MISRAADGGRGSLELACLDEHSGRELGSSSAAAGWEGKGLETNGKGKEERQEGRTALKEHRGRRMAGSEAERAAGRRAQRAHRCRTKGGVGSPNLDEKESLHTR